ncbi:MAG: hypothetical protein QM765_25625 [Myxococcales bacterium]
MNSAGSIPATSLPRRRYHQIKKATDNDPDAQWSLASVARVLLGNALAKLQGNQDEQVWVLGDRLADEVQTLLAAGRNAPEQRRDTYLVALHRLAKAEAQVTDGLDDTSLKHRLDRWNPTSQASPINQDVEQTVSTFVSLAAGVPQVRIDGYRNRMAALHTVLPDVLARITARSYHGTERQIADHVRKLLVDRYELIRSPSTTSSFATCAASLMTSRRSRTVPSPSGNSKRSWSRSGHGCLCRRSRDSSTKTICPGLELVQALVAPTVAREAVGPSGSGKTSLASETYLALTALRPDAAVLFVEVRTRTSLRDVLVGVAHSLRRRGIGSITGPALDLRASDTATIERVAARLGALTREIFLLIDCADGEVSGEFRRDLAVFIRALRGATFHLLAFAQASVFRNLTPLERTALGISQEAMPGLHFGQFLSLIRRRHPDVDVSAIHEVYELLTSGLPTGMLPNLAQQIARARSLAEMQEIVRQPPDQRLSAAHRDRFFSLPPGLQQAASRIVCLSLPLAARELIALFPQDLIKAALLALVEEGLLPPFADRVEMHETVRAGLESLVPPVLAKETHEILASYFARRELLPAQIHHLEKAGRGEDARRLARERFLAGRDWYDLVEYVGARKCVSADEVLSLLFNAKGHERYLLRDLLPRIQTAGTASQLLESLRSDPQRYSQDFQRTWLLQETLLQCEPTLLTPLAAFALEQPEREGCDIINWLRTNACRAGVAPDASFVQWFRSLRVEAQKKVVGFLLLKPQQPRLQEALAFMHRHGLPCGARGHTFHEPILELTTDEEIADFLKALPPADPSKMLLVRSALLGPFESYVWHERVDLRRVSRGLVEQGTAEAPVLANAIRVLIFLNEREVVPLTRHLRNADGALATLAWMTPVILDSTEELPELEAIALAPETELESRAMAIAMVAHLGGEPGKLLKRAAAVRPEQQRALETLLMLQAELAPFPEAVPLVSAALDEDLAHHRIFGGILQQLAEASFPGTEALLIKALRSPSAELVMHALVALGRSRFHRGLIPILEVVHSSKNAEFRAFAIPAALASGPNSADLFGDVWEHTPEAAHWRWVLAGRLRDTREASALVAVATDATQDWKSRRLAILAAGRLPFAAAMEAIAPVILKAPLVLAEESPRFQTHALLTLLLDVAGARDLAPRFRRGRDGFLHALAPLYEDWSEELIDARGLLPAVDAVGWLWDRLESHGFGSAPRAVDKVANELHVAMLQAAVLLGLRRQGRRDDLFIAFEQASTNWLRIRAFNELCHGEPLSVEDERRSQALISSASPLIQSVLRDFFGRRPRRERPPAVRRSESKPAPLAQVRLGFVQAQAFLKSLGSVDSKAIVLDVDERDLRTLVVELDPARDTEWRPAPDAKPARVSLSGTSWRLRGGFALEQASPHYEQRSALRPAVAAANRFGIEIPWHRAALTGELRELYADRFFACLGAHNDRDALVRMLTDESEAPRPAAGEPWPRQSSAPSRRRPGVASSGPLRPSRTRRLLRAVVHANLPGLHGGGPSISREGLSSLAGAAGSTPGQPSSRELRHARVARRLADPLSPTETPAFRFHPSAKKPATGDPDPAPAVVAWAPGTDPGTAEGVASGLPSVRNRGVPPSRLRTFHRGQGRKIRRGCRRALSSNSVEH